MRMGPVLEAVYLSVIPEMPSGQLAFDVPRLDNISNTFSSEQISNSIGQSKGCKCGNSSMVSGGKDWLKQVAKKPLRVLAFSAGV